MGSNTISARARRASTRFINHRHLECLEKCGVKIEKKSEYHFRVEGKLDLWVTNQKFHNLATQERGEYEYVLDVIQQQIGLPKWFGLKKVLHRLNCSNCKNKSFVKKAHQEYISDFI